jgi:hypothetical protein
MSASSEVARTRYKYPLHAILVVIAAWLFMMVLLGCYATVAIALFPMSPLVAIGGASMIGMAHNYAISVRSVDRG